MPSAPALAPPLPDVVDDLRRREFLGLLAAAGLLVGCGADETASPATPGTTRTVVTPLGPVEIPADPRRIVTLDVQSLEFALTVGAPVVGSATRTAQEPYSEALDGRTEGITSVSDDAGETDLEALALLRPDLILTQTWAVEELRDQLSAIAPVVAFDYWTDDSFTTIRWEEHLREVADALGRADEVEGALTDLESAIADFRSRYPGDPAEVELSIVKLQEGEWFFQTPLSFPGQIVERLGFSRPAAQSTTDTDRVYLSYEELGQAAGDEIVLMSEAADADAVAMATELPLWASLDAVRESRVSQVDGQLWLLGGGPLAGVALVESLAAALSLPA